MSNSIVKSGRRLSTLVAVGTLVALPALLAACGGGGGGDATVGTTSESAVEYVPAAASDGVSVFAGWLKQLSTQSNEDREAMNTSTFAPTVQEEVEPVTAPQ